MVDYVATGGPIVLGALIALTEALKWPRWFHYVWAALAIFWGLMSLI